MVAEVDARLAGSGVTNASVEACWLVEEVSGLDAAELGMVRDDPATARARRALEQLVARRASGEPLQYVLGSWAFGQLDLLVDRRVLIPRPETELVAEIAIDEMERHGARRGRVDPWAGAATAYTVADLGTGCGAIALALAAALPDAAVWATDVSEDALAVTCANLAGAGTSAARVRIALGSWFDALPASLRGTLRLVVSNPPYVADSELASLPPEVRDWEPTSALVSGPTGLEAYDVIVGQVPEWLEPEGSFVCELAPERSGAVADLARTAGLADVEVRPDLTGRDRVLVARRPG